MTDNPTRLRRLFGRLARTGPLPPWLPLAAGALVGGLLGGAYGQLRAPTYTATSYIVVVPTEKSDTASALGFAQAYGRAATQLAVLGDAQVWAGVPVQTLQRNVRTATSPDAPVVAVSASSARPGRAADMANAVTRALTRRANATKGSTHVGLVQFTRAVRPTEPTSASPTVTGVVGTSAGGLLGSLVLLVRPRKAKEEAGRSASVPGPAVAADMHGQL
ncbi:lipopolysaccharide biosynthesis protein [Streptomyces sp. NPDC005202]|uniref:lipopolysaccharide biosynthesis protein n=1 Tax=Streptomyces sp. NPDC005202 TaxID=3157021 RepID=UPI0033B1805C